MADAPPLSRRSSSFQRPRETYAVRVENFGPQTAVQDVIAAFNRLIGEVRSCEEGPRTGSGCSLELQFQDYDTTKKALCMSGYTIAGYALLVTAVRPQPDRSFAKQGGRPDTRRNLYVLGLPFDMTRNEFSELFSRCGTVSHCVILATPDNASRRRGFVVMSTHEEAQHAMRILTRSEIQGHVIDVSWAVVQRSHGFLDGGDRFITTENHSAGVSGSTGCLSENTLTSPDGSPYSSELGVPHYFSTDSNVPMPSKTLLVSNLPNMLFSQTLDLHPLFYPFGAINRLEMLDPSPADTAAGRCSAIIEYTSLSSAEDAKSTLQGQFYANFAMNVRYLDNAVAEPAQHSARSYHQALPHFRDGLAPLSPYAPPFVQTTAPMDTNLSASPPSEWMGFCPPVPEMLSTLSYGSHAHAPHVSAPVAPSQSLPPGLLHERMPSSMPPSGLDNTWWNNSTVNTFTMPAVAPIPQRNLFV